MFVFIQQSAGASDFCTWEGKPANTNFTLWLDDEVLKFDKYTAIGQPMLTKSLKNNAVPLGTLTCSKAPNAHHYRLSGLTLVNGYTNVFSSGIPGIGIRIVSGGETGAVTSYGGYLPTFDNSVYGPYTPRTTFDLQLIRTGRQVGSGSHFLGFRIDMGSAYASTIPIYRASWSFASTLTVINESLYASCEPVKPVDRVDMGVVLSSDLQAGRAPVQPFSFDVRCQGLDKPNHRVRAYFDGSSPRAGILETQTGEGRVTGVAVALKDAQGHALTFGSRNLHQLALTGQDAEGHLYRFTGTAQYVKTGQSFTTGKADASLTYVLDYN
ncbi:fimbrial protein [Pseudomonas sp. TCU-HL1]|uniref:fimbrial protein n=1 Tax=Pseudomonas sp. TCU-HL1 TaxID=1856685 RepID=UPI00083CF2E9|nr:fimbrial protein [Pseudomonas sp. TCU-HL1]AOE82998.1 hypothetical protein THL1_450 [Pseudomonas sp. TCU-HL1]